MNHAHMNQAGMLDLIYQSGWMAKFILLVLFASSIVCWSIIISKWKKLNSALKQNEKFMAVFWNGKNIEDIMAKSSRFTESPLASMFKNGIKELNKFSSDTSNDMQVENIQRNLLRSSVNEVAVLEKHIHWLATTASAAPFIGLFGTVWGIMNSFQSIGVTGAASLSVVAPGISEALITTATGIGTAVPAVIAYNFFLGQIKKVVVDMECFTQDFINIVQRNLHDRKRD